MKLDEILYCFRIEDLDGDGGLLDELLSALEFDHSSWFDRETCRVWHTVYSATPEARDAALARFHAELPEWKTMGVTTGAEESFALRDRRYMSRLSADATGMSVPYASASIRSNQRLRTSVSHLK